MKPLSELGQSRRIVQLKNTSIGSSSIVLISNLPLAQGRIDREQVEMLLCRGVNMFCLDDIYEDIDYALLFEEIKELQNKNRTTFMIEAKDTSQLLSLFNVADIITINGENASNRALLTAVGESRLPVLLKRGNATIEEWLFHAHAISAQGNPVILCEDGIKTFNKQKTIDISAIPALKELTDYPVLLKLDERAEDNINKGIGLAGIAAGADGLIIDHHLSELDSFFNKLRSLAHAVEREILLDQ